MFAPSAWAMRLPVASYSRRYTPKRPATTTRSSTASSRPSIASPLRQRRPPSSARQLRHRQQRPLPPRRTPRSISLTNGWPTASEFGFTVEPAAAAASFDVAPPVATASPDFEIAAPPAQFAIEVPEASAAAAAAAAPEISIEVSAPAPPAPAAAPEPVNVLG